METRIREDQEFVVEWQLLRPAQDRDVVIDLTSERHHPGGTGRSGPSPRDDFAVVTGTPRAGGLRQARMRHPARRSQVDPRYAADEGGGALLTSWKDGRSPG